jgi:hypothetical protein
MGAFRLLADMMQQHRKKLTYELSLKLDVGHFVPAIYVEEKGEISLAR